MFFPTKKNPRNLIKPYVRGAQPFGNAARSDFPRTEHVCLNF